MCMETNRVREFKYLLMKIMGQIIQPPNYNRTIWIIINISPFSVDWS
jgi:hypothetical protein